MIAKFTSKSYVDEINFHSHLRFFFTTVTYVSFFVMQIPKTRIRIVLISFGFVIYEMLNITLYV